MNKNFMIYASVAVLVSVLLIFMTTRPEKVVAPEQAPENAMDEVGSDLSDDEKIRASLAKKNGWNWDEIEVVVNQNDGSYATGLVNMVGAPAGGGVWFAANVGDTWQIVWDGNGTVMCENLVDYPDYPVELIPQCYDAETGEMVSR